MRTVLHGARIFDGARLLTGMSLALSGETVEALAPEAEARALDGSHVELSGGILSPGFLDLQVNGGGGLMLDGSVDEGKLTRILDAHRHLGTAGLLPTLITDTREATRAVIETGIRAAQKQLPGFLGLHLEGPHLDVRRKGAHDAALIRPMEEVDLELLCYAARHLPVLMVTIAPEAVRMDQIVRLKDAGVIVSIGHSDCAYETALSAFDHGVTCATHLFNAMSQLGNRAPGLVGAVLDRPVAAGIIADGIHVSGPALRIALAAKRDEGLFLVTDAMAVAGTDLDGFTLGGRKILRRDGRLTLEDGTLAGADVSLPQALRYLKAHTDLPLETLLAMVTSRPAKVTGLASSHGALAAGRQADVLHLTDGLTLVSVWHGGELLQKEEGEV
ncbi:N-acetylglucosamine-6-phosphate deacetylase [Pannonibacter phragmitetus]|uniref:N-acetylglucosamine-6-phosphate deacetylase n=1 Tax=Pannonibacter phragmitetus TaxID=121719 RepID=UPI003D2EB267